MKMPKLNAVPVPPEILGRHYTVAAQYFAGKGVALTTMSRNQEWDRLLQLTYDRGDVVVGLDEEEQVVAMYLKPLPAPAGERAAQ
jgi:hypothetical protein